MKVVILAGGYGTRISEESILKPKPMIEIGGMPILWHIMKIYSAQGFNEFIICAGYKQNKIKEWFSDYFINTSDVTFDFSTNDITIHNKHTEPWKVTIVDTGLNTDTGGRVKLIRDYVGNESFMLTYGDGVADINLSELVYQHRKNNDIVTMSVYKIAQNKGIIEICDGKVKDFREKSSDDANLINIGYMVCEPEFFDYIDGDVSLEKYPIKKVLSENKLGAYHHNGFWQCMDTLKEKQQLESLWDSGNAKWKIW